MTMLVTGATGFTGKVLLHHLITSGKKGIAGIARTVPEDYIKDPKVRIVPCDLLDLPRVRKVIQDLHPDRIIHLAGLNRGTPDELFKANVTGAQNLLDTIQDVNPACRTLIVSSSAVYGYAGKKPIDEDTPVRPLSDYGVSKTAQEQVVRERRDNNGPLVTIARPFNLVGPGQPASFLCSRIVHQVVEIERGSRKNLTLMETRSYRDFIDVRDAVRAYWALITHPDFERVCAGSAFNVGSGTAHAVSDVISLVEKITGRTYVVDLPEDPPVVLVPYQQADLSRIRSVTGWKPGISLKESLEDMLEAERERRAGKIL